MMKGKSRQNTETWLYPPISTTKLSHTSWFPRPTPLSDRTVPANPGALVGPNSKGIASYP